MRRLLSAPYRTWLLILINKSFNKNILKRLYKSLQSFFSFDIIIDGLKKLPKTVGELDS